MIMKKKSEYSFDARYRTTVLCVMEQLGTVYASTRKQTENGTLLFHDPQTGVDYGFYESGYCRRIVGGTYTTNYCYQLNRTVRVNGRYVRTLANPLEQLGIVTGAVVHYRSRMDC